ncbi:nucleotidyltransferase domain-containing protein [candidate division WOR-3 bacterium]|nr:nucleotidyltransferase domain-containing protein [candidate division WOR-3 bacterium]
MRDENLMKIKEVIRTIFPDSRVILFGSRGRGNFDERSDYDILVIIKHNSNIKETRRYESIIRKQLVEIPIDVIVKTEEDANYYRDKIGSVVREAIKEGVSL